LRFGGKVKVGKNVKILKQHALGVIARYTIYSEQPGTNGKSST
jgi:hypothetical protein